MGDMAPEERKPEVCTTSGPSLQIHQLFIEILQQEAVCSFTHSPFTCLLCTRDPKSELIDQLIQASSYYGQADITREKRGLAEVLPASQPQAQDIA